MGSTRQPPVFVPKSFIFLLPLALFLLVATLFLAGPQEEPEAPAKPSDGKEASASSDSPVLPSGEGEGFKGVLSRFESVFSLSDGAGRAAEARGLRRRLLADPSLIPEVVQLVKDRGLPVQVRAGYAVVLGSLPGGKEPLAVLLAEGGAAGIERSVVLAIGIVPIESGKLFEREGQPFAVEAADGLTVFVRREVGEADFRRTLLGLLGGEQAGWAVARVLRDSVGYEEVREAFLEDLSASGKGEKAGEVSAALCKWAGDAPVDDPGRIAVVDRLLGLFADTDETVRFRLSAPLGSARLTPAEEGRLRDTAVGGDEEARHFAIEVLGRRLGGMGGAAEQTLDLLSQRLSDDPSAQVRETAARVLGTPKAGPAAVTALMDALQADKDWEVRAAAVQALGRVPLSDEVRQALRQASDGDPREEVRTAARRTLTR